MEDETMTSLHQAAVSLGEEASRRGQEQLLEDTAAENRPILIEGNIHGICLQIMMPGLEVWNYMLTGEPEGRTLLAFIDPANPQTAAIFRPSAEGIHPFLCIAARLGVERSAK